MRYSTPLIGLLLLCIGCKPEIKEFIVSPAEFCGCTDINVRYQITGAITGTLTTSPSTSTLSVVVLDQLTSATIRVCETTTVTLTAINDNGETSSSAVSTLVDPIPPYTKQMVPCIRSGAWSSLTDLLHPPVANAEITTVEFTPDREGILSYGDTNVPVRAGRNMLTSFEGRIFNNEFQFSAPLRPNETCAGTSTGPDGRIPPPTFSITLSLRCRTGT